MVSLYQSVCPPQSHTQHRPRIVQLACPPGKESQGYSLKKLNQTVVESHRFQYGCCFPNNWKSPSFWDWRAGGKQLILYPFLLKWNLLALGLLEQSCSGGEKGKKRGHHDFLQHGRAELLICADLSRDPITSWAGSVPYRVANYNSPAGRNFHWEIQ